MKFANIFLLWLCCGSCFAQALVLDDFAPNLVSSGDQVDKHVTSPLITFSFPESSSQQHILKPINNVWACDKNSNPACDKPASSDITKQAAKPSGSNDKPPAVTANQGANEQYFNRNGNSFDQNAINNFNITNSNQTTMQAYSAQLNNATIEDKLKQNIAIPLSTGSNSAVSVGTNNVQFNVSY